MNNMIGVAADHAAYEIKEFIVGWLSAKGYEVVDYGCMSEESVDYADFGHALGRGMESGEVSRGVAFCGSGEGMSMTLNRHKGVRAGLCWCEEIARLTRQHNDSNVIVMPARFIDNDEAIVMVSTWLSTEFEGGRHQPRIEKIEL
ncbi:MAG: RpiB/LacA/LacB family sugar-phosphate isomerase [Rikenellaceae bacterium]